MKTLITLLAVSVVAGCVAPQPPTPSKPRVTVNTNPPRCYTQRQCDRMWLDAQESLQMVSRMRLRLVTETRLETFAARGISGLTGTVVKYPLDDGAYELMASFECGLHSGCDDLIAMATNTFNLSFPPTYPPEKKK